ncbi:MAG: 3'-5' exonuclease [Deltaproteobacteria bacterium]|nr:3'-5' exonuclease [Deltaproteobacteria bacterium]
MAQSFWLWAIFSLIVPSLAVAKSQLAEVRTQLQWARQQVATQRPGATLSLGQRPALHSWIRGLVYQQLPKLAKSPALAARGPQTSLDPTFFGRHPMFRRLVAERWFSNTQMIDALQRKADRLLSKPAREISLDRLELIALDLEATGGEQGGVLRNGKDQRWRFGYDQPIQLGYSIYRGRKLLGRGSILVRPDVPLAEWTKNNTSLSETKLKGARTFEQVAGQLLDLLDGRVIVGQSLETHDWAWLRSSFARLGVELPTQRQRFLDTYYLSRQIVDARSRQVFARGTSLKRSYAFFFGDAFANHHDAEADAVATAEVLFAIAAQRGVKTLGELHGLQWARSAL